MRKGIEKIIESLHKSGIHDYRYEEYLIESSLSLKVIGTINRYYTACVRAGQDFDAVMDEILKYDSLSVGLDIVLSCNWKTGDILLGKDNIKAEILSKCKDSKAKTFSYTLLCHYVLPAYKDDKELCNLLFEVADKWDESVEHEYDALGFTARYYCNYKTNHEGHGGWINIDELKQNPDILKSILESQISEFDKCYNPYFYHNYNREVENYHFFKEYFDITTNRLFESIDHFTIIDKYERIITVTIGEDGNVKITATTTVKFLSVKDSNYFSFDPRFNRVDEANSLKNIKFLIYNNDSHAVDVVKDIRSKIIDHGDGARWRYQVNNILPLPLPAECKNLKIIHEYSFCICRCQNRTCTDFQPHIAAL